MTWAMAILLKVMGVVWASLGNGGLRTGNATIAAAKTPLAGALPRTTVVKSAASPNPTSPDFSTPQKSTPLVVRVEKGAKGAAAKGREAANGIYLDRRT